MDPLGYRYLYPIILDPTLIPASPAQPDLVVQSQVLSVPVLTVLYLTCIGRSSCPVCFYAGSRHNRQMPVVRPLGYYRCVYCL